MNKPKPTEKYKAEIRRQWDDASTRVEQKKILVDAAAAIGYTYSGFVRLLELNKRKRPPSDKQALRMQEDERYARRVFELKIRSTFDGKYSTWLGAYESLVSRGEIPSHITMKRIYQAKERLHLDNEAVSTHGTVMRSEPLELVQIDYTKSVFFHFNAQEQIFFEPYKVKESESRLWIGAGVDVVSGVCYLQYFIAAGESSNFVMDVMLKIFDEKVSVDTTTGEINGHEKLLQGIPKEFYGDRGSGNKSKETKRFLEKLGIKRILGGNLRDRGGNLTSVSNKRGRGMVEKLIGDFKRQFEMKLCHEHDDKTLPPAVTLDFLNHRLREWCIARNTSTHPKYRDAKRWDLFEHVLASCEFPNDDARTYGTASETYRNVQGLVTARGKSYVAPLWSNSGDDLEIVFKNKKVYVYDSGELTLLEPQHVVRERLETEFEQESYDGVELKKRFNEELKFCSDGLIVLARLPQSLDDDKLEFFSKSRTLEEIRERARYFVVACQPKECTIIPYNTEKG